MRIAQPVRFGVWVVILLNLIMAFVSVWVLLRMSPAIERILVHNDSSIQMCEEMIVTLAKSRDSEVHPDSLVSEFARKLNRTSTLVSEKVESELIREIDSMYKSAILGDSISYLKTIESLQKLSLVNHEAMKRADFEERAFGSAGAWIIVSMAISIFIAGILLTRSLAKNSIEPLEEIIAVVAAHKKGNRQRRCAIGDYPSDIRLLFSEINEFLDDHSRPIQHTTIKELPREPE